MAKYRKKPVMVEAIQWKGNPVSFSAISMMGGNRDIEISSDYKTLRITTLEGVMTASTGDYIIKGISGELYPCKPDIFIATYEKLGED